MIRVICSGCGAHLGEVPGTADGLVSHGLCRGCAVELYGEELVAGCCFPAPVVAELPPVPPVKTCAATATGSTTTRAAC